MTATYTWDVSSGLRPILEGAGDFDLELLETHTFDGRTQELVYRASSHVDADVDAVFLGGNGFRAAGAIEALEERLGCLVLESNQVLLWSAMAETGTAAEVHGCGSLLQSLSPTAPTGATDR